MGNIYTALLVHR